MRDLETPRFGRASAEREREKESRMKIAAPFLNEAGFRVLGQIDPRTESNIAISPTSLSQAVMMAYMGAKGTTRTELLRFLALPSMEPEKLEDWIAAAAPREGRAAGTVAVSISNSAWLRRGFSVEPAYAKSIKKAFDADLFGFADSDDGSRRIGEWIAKRSHGNLDARVPPLGKVVYLRLVNLIHFKGRWKTVFEKSETKPRLFHEPTSRAIQVPMMHVFAKFQYGASDSAQIAVLPYEKSSYEMVVVLPDGAARTGLTRDLFDRLVSLAEKSRPRRGDLLMPRFTIDRLYDFTELAKALGLKGAFSRSANFDGIAPGLHLGSIWQRCRILVDEDGTLASTFTMLDIHLGATFEPELPPFYLELNRPFYFAVRDRSTGAILFLGKVNSP